MRVQLHPRDVIEPELAKAGMECEDTLMLELQEFTEGKVGVDNETFEGLNILKNSDGNAQIIEFGETQYPLVLMPFNSMTSYAGYYLSQELIIVVGKIIP